MALALSLYLVVAGAAQVEVAPELERLMAQYGFQMKPADLETTRDQKGRAEEGTELLPRLRALLEGFNHIIVQSGQGGVERVLILGAKTPYTPPPANAPKAGDPPAAGEITLETQRIGSSQAVTLILEGTNGQRVQRQLLVDTGADYVVLPRSLIGALGLPPDALHAQQVQTANGNVEAVLGTLPAIWLKESRVAEVPVAFIDDERLGGNALLGMSLLNRFSVKLESEQNRLVLGRK
nr:retropepsin-like aspartic protease [uncultured Thiodictyon sp.]